MTAEAPPQEQHQPLRGRRVAGPTAIDADVRRLAHLTVTLALSDFKVRFFGSVLGYLWQLVRPLMLFGVLYVVFSKFLAVGVEVEYFAVSLLWGIVLYSFLAEATSQALRSLVARENIMRKIAFPRLAVPLSSVLVALFNLALNLIPVFVFLLLAGGTPRWSWLQLPLVVVGLTAFALGLAMLLSALYVHYRDVEPIWDVVLQVMFYGSPILYTVGMVMDRAGETAAHALMLNPFAALMQQGRHALIGPSHTPAADAIGGAVWLLIPAAIGVAALGAGAIVFARRAPLVAEEL